MIRWDRRMAIIAVRSTPCGGRARPCLGRFFGAAIKPPAQQGERASGQRGSASGQFRLREVRSPFGFGEALLNRAGKIAWCKIEEFVETARAESCHPDRKTYLATSLEIETRFSIVQRIDPQANAVKAASATLLKIFTASPVGVV